MSRHLIYQSYRALLPSVRVQCNCQHVCHQHVYNNMAVWFELRRTNVKFKNVASPEYEGLELDNRTAQQWIFITVTRHSNSVHIGHRHNLLRYQVLELLECNNTHNKEFTPLRHVSVKIYHRSRVESATVKTKWSYYRLWNSVNTVSPSIASCNTGTMYFLKMEHLYQRCWNSVFAIYSYLILKFLISLIKEYDDPDCMKWQL